MCLVKVESGGYDFPNNSRKQGHQLYDAFNLAVKGRVHYNMGLMVVYKVSRVHGPCLS